jgi:hypothetical protein
MYSTPVRAWDRDVGDFVAGKVMRRAVLVLWLLGWVWVLPVAAQEARAGGGPPTAPVCEVTLGWEPAPPDVPAAPEKAPGIAFVLGLEPQPDAQPAPAPTPAPDAKAPAAACEPGHAEPPPWELVWGVAGVRVFAAGPKEAPNGQTYHPYHSLDLDFNIWILRSQGLYLFSESRFWNERPENGVTNAKDSFLGFSKREFDMNFGAAWNYWGFLEARAYGYTDNNLNRGTSPVLPKGLNDGFVMENRYYLSPEYANLGRAGYDITRANFVSIGYYASKDLVGNDGQTFNPGLLLRAYLTYDLWDWPAYAFADVSYISERSMQPKLLLYDLGLALRPFRDWPRFSALKTWEIRLGAENTADFQEHDVQNLWYGSIRIIF